MIYIIYIVQCVPKEGPSGSKRCRMMIVMCIEDCQAFAYANFFLNVSIHVEICKCFHSQDSIPVFSFPCVFFCFFIFIPVFPFSCVSIPLSFSMQIVRLLGSCTVIWSSDALGRVS